MPKKPAGIVALAGAFFAAAAAGLAAFSAAFVAWLRTPGTSPLASLFTLTWTGTFLGAAVLTWRRSRGAAPALIAATGLLLVVLSFLFPGGRIQVAMYAATVLLALAGYRYLRGACEPARSGA
jgi:hypothetical protein